MQSNKDKCSKKQRNIRNKNHSITLIEADSRPKQTPQISNSNAPRKILVLSRLVSRRVQNKHHKSEETYRERAIRKRAIRVLGFFRERIEAIYGKKRKPESHYVVASYGDSMKEALEGKSHLFWKYYNDFSLFLLFINLNFTIKQNKTKSSSMLQYFFVEMCSLGFHSITTVYFFDRHHHVDQQQQWLFFL